MMFVAEESGVSLMDHFRELRWRLLVVFFGFLVATGLCYGMSESLFQLLGRPLQRLLEETPSPHRRIIYTGLPEAFLTYVKMALFGGVVLTFPLFAYHAWRFVVPGLYQHERRFFLFFLSASPALFLVGMAFAYTVVVPAAWAFFLSFEQWGENTLQLQLEARASEYIATMMQILLAFGVCFQMPLVLLVLEKMGVVTRESLKKNRKYAFLAIVVVAAICTPPDIISPLGLLIPLYTLYEISISLMSWSFFRRK